MHRVILAICLMIALVAPASAQTLGSGDVSNGTVQATGSTTPRKLSDRAADTLNVKNFGAKGDGTTDDAAAIQAAINAGGTAGGVVLLPPGVYKLSQPLTCASKIAIQGAGTPATIFKPFAAIAEMINITTAYCNVSGITFNQDDTTQLAQRAILINKPVNNSPIHLDDLNFNKGLCSTCTYPVADIEVQQGDDLFIHRTHHVSSGGTAILFSQTNGFTFDSEIDRIKVLGENGVDFACSGLNHAEGTRVSNSHIFPGLNGQFAVRMSCGVGNFITDNILGQARLPNAAAIILDGTNSTLSSVTVSGGWTDCGAQIGQDGIQVLGAATGISITGGNKTVGCARYGIYVDGGTLLLNTTAATAAGNAVLTFTTTTGSASTGNTVSPCNISWTVVDVTTPTAIPANTTVSACSPTTLTLSNNAAGAGVGNGDQIQLYQQASSVTITGNKLGSNGGTGANLVSDIYASNAPGIVIMGNTSDSLTGVIEAGVTQSQTIGNSFRLGSVLTRNLASQWAFNYHSNADGLQLVGFGTAVSGAKITTGASVTYGGQGITVAGSTPATNATTSVSSLGSSGVQIVSNGTQRASFIAPSNISNQPLSNTSSVAQNFNTTPTYTFGNGVAVVMNTAGASSGVAATITMPAAANVVDGMQIMVVCGFGLTSVTWAANTSQTMVAGGSVACPAGTAAQFMYRATGTTWYKTS